MNDDILKGRFIQRVFSETAVDIEKAQNQLMSERGFSNSDWGDRRFLVSDSALVYQHLGKHRFVDMRTRNTAQGKITKKSHPIHNKIIYGHYGNIVRELGFGYTDAVREEMFLIEKDF
ncbi:hypothetical protein [Flavobacterium sp. NKUCC04_CG]|uniref:hypothetical protein n=1 Tax=Flavobacterium sp. NKUCC04_CG TaxID=2842121 RepID=UPI001C5BBCAE|nr:hypothetical protein [Flavobacterium sp. NKUCC04_CG]MBW3519495.1 hypothetical protein [Flavobacterium sp. NKUCC04_CG]